MPLYALYAKDKPDGLARRLEHYPAHRAFIEAQDGSAGITVIMSGPLQTDDGESMIGSIILVEASTREEVDQFVAQDPFMREGVWGELHIARYYRRYAAGHSLPPP